MACEPEISKALGREPTPRELGRIKREALRLKDMADINRKDPLALEALWGRFKDTRQAQALVARRAAARNYAAGQRLREWRKSVPFLAKNPAEGLKALTHGSLSDFHGARDNVLQKVQHDVEARVGAYWNELEFEGVAEYVKSPESYDAVGEAIFDLKHHTDVGVVTKKHGAAAAKAARILIKHDEAARVDLNREGAAINDNPARIASRVIDPNRVAKAGGAKWGQGYAAWKADAEKMDWEKSFDGEFLNETAAEREKLLKRVYDNDISGAHPDFSEDGSSGFGRGTGIAKKSSHSRDIIFKNAADEISYMKKYSRGENLAEAVWYGLQSAGRDVQIMRKFGPNPKQTWNKLVSDWLDDIRHDESIPAAERPARMKALADENTKQLRNIWPSIVDETGHPGDNLLAKFIAFSRGGALISARLGLSGITTVGDVPLRMKYARYWGEESAKNSVTEGTRHVIRTFMQLPEKERKQVAAEWGFRFQTINRPMGLTPEDEFGLGFLARFSQHTMKWGSHSFLNNGQHVGAAVADGARFASYADSAHADLNPGTQRALRQFGIGEKDWEILRQQTPEEYQGTKVFQPGNVREMPVEKFRSIAPDNASEEQLFRARELLADKFRNMLGEMATNFSSESSLSNRAIITMGTKRGTALGETLRSGMALKSWVIKYMREGIAGELHGYDQLERLPFGKALWSTLTSKGGGRAGLASLITSGLVAGYAWAALHDIAVGKTPVNPVGEHGWEAFFRAFAFQGLGLITDFTLAEERANTDMPISTSDRIIDILGPGLGTIVDFMDLAQSTARQIASGTFHKNRGKDAQRLFSTIYHNIPGNNLYWAKYALDYLVVNNISNMLNPGYAKRLEARAKQRGQHYLFGAAPK